MSPSAIRRGLAQRIRARAPEIVEVPQIGGTTATPASTAVRCLAIRSEDAERESPGRTGAEVGVRRRWSIDLLHAADPTAGVGVWDVALDDEARIRDALLRTADDVLRPIEHRIVWIGSSAPVLEGGGAYRRVTLQIETTTCESLE